MKDLTFARTFDGVLCAEDPIDESDWNHRALYAMRIQKLTGSRDLLESKASNNDFLFSILDGYPVPAKHSIRDFKSVSLRYYDDFHSQSLRIEGELFVIPILNDPESSIYKETSSPKEVATLRNCIALFTSQNETVLNICFISTCQERKYSKISDEALPAVQNIMERSLNSENTEVGYKETADFQKYLTELLEPCAENEIRDREDLCDILHDQSSRLSGHAEALRRYAVHGTIYRGHAFLMGDTFLMEDKLLEEVGKYNYTFSRSFTAEFLAIWFRACNQIHAEFKTKAEAYHKEFGNGEEFVSWRENFANDDIDRIPLLYKLKDEIIERSDPNKLKELETTLLIGYHNIDSDNPGHDYDYDFASFRDPKAECREETEPTYFNARFASRLYYLTILEVREKIKMGKITENS